MIMITVISNNNNYCKPSGWSAKICFRNSSISRWLVSLMPLLINAECTKDDKPANWRSIVSIRDLNKGIIYLRNTVLLNTALLNTVLSDMVLILKKEIIYNFKIILMKSVFFFIFLIILRFLIITYLFEFFFSGGITIRIYFYIIIIKNKTSL